MAGNTNRTEYDVIIIGAGLAGLTLSRHLLLYTGKTILLLDKRLDPPREAPQKYGESLVQASGYYFGKVLDLEEHLLIDQYLKYNLRFHWPTAGLANRGLEDYSLSFIRTQSNIATFQLDRNLFEAHLLRTNRQNPRFEFLGGVRNVCVDLSETGDCHRVCFEGGDVRGRWVIDASGRGGVLKRQLELAQPNPIRHGATFCWVEGLVNIEKLTGRKHQEVLYDRKRSQTGHFPAFLATNHFCAEGQWFWVIPLHHKTSLGLVYDHNVVDAEEVSNTRKLIDYVCRQWPLFARDLPYRKILDEGRLIDFSYDCRETISPRRWALIGEAGRFSDPLYSPGSDLIAIYNTLVVDAIETEGEQELRRKCRAAEQIQRVVYESYVPSYAVSYDCLGDQEAFSLKYSWELAVYFGFFVFPMLNNVFANREFMPGFLRRFARLGPINANLQRTLSAFYQWKKQQPSVPPAEPQLFDFYMMAPLAHAEKMFYKTGLEPEEAIAALDQLLSRLREFARYILTHIHASVLGNHEVLTNAAFVESLDLHHTVFHLESMHARYARYAGAPKKFDWRLDPDALEKFIPDRRSVDSLGRFPSAEGLFERAGKR
jgi:2-polyprenyl-6-methoxyphenol hydroxylase-like FAD-dependent oxidoreductase